MRVIEQSEFRDESGVISLENRIRGTLRFGTRWYSNMEAQAAVTERLDTVLKSDHVLIRNLLLPTTNLIVPMILVGPQGVRALVPTTLRGVFRAKGEEWLTFHGGSGHFRRVRPNQQAIALTSSEAVFGYLRKQGFGVPDVEAVLIFVNPRTHVDSARPRVRIVLADAIDHFAANLLQLNPIMDQEDIESVVQALIHPTSPQVAAGAETAEEPPPAPPRAAALPSGPMAFGPAASDVVEALRTGAAVPPEEAIDLETEEIVMDAPFQAADILPKLKRGVRAGVPRVREGVERLGDEVYRLDENVQRLARKGTRRLPKLSTSQWLLLGLMVLVELIVLAAMVVMVLSDVLYG